MRYLSVRLSDLVLVTAASRQPNLTRRGMDCQYQPPPETRNNLLHRHGNEKNIWRCFDVS